MNTTALLFLNSSFLPSLPLFIILSAPSRDKDEGWRKMEEKKGWEDKETRDRWKGPSPSHYQKFAVHFLFSSSYILLRHVWGTRRPLLRDVLPFQADVRLSEIPSWEKRGLDEKRRRTLCSGEIVFLGASYGKLHYYLPRFSQRRRDDVFCIDAIRRLVSERRSEPYKKKSFKKFLISGVRVKLRKKLESCIFILSHV